MTVYGLPIPDIPDGWQPLEACVVVKCLDETGIVRLCDQFTDGLNSWEALGMLDLSASAIRARLVQSFNDDDDDD